MTEQKKDRRWRQFEKRLRRIMKGSNGERCSLCRRPFGAASNMTYGGFDEQKNVVLVGDCCLHELTEVLSVGFFVCEPPPWKKDDAEWFKQNRRRTHRLRLAFPGEAEGALDPDTLAAIERTEALVYVAVRQIESGTRARMSSIWAKGSTLPDSEEFAHALFDFLVSAGQVAQAKGGIARFTKADISALARQYQTGAVS